MRRKAAVQKICQNAKAPIVEFEPYRILDFDNTAPQTYYTLSKNSGAIYIGSLSCILPYALPLSWVVLPHHLINAAHDLHFQQFGPYNNTIYQQLLIYEMFKNDLFYPYLDTIKSYIRQRTALTQPLIHQYLGDLCEIHDKHPLAYWVKLPVSSRELVKFNDKVKVVSGISHSAKADRYITISKVSPSEMLYEEGLSVLRDILLSLK